MSICSAVINNSYNSFSFLYFLPLITIESSVITTLLSLWIMYILPQLNMKDVDYIADIEIWCNSLPRKILNYRTPDEVFEDKLDLIYRQTAS